MEDSDQINKDRMRICPSCRNAISVLAVKCHYCGEEVGKPKEEQRTLSIHDLGGEVVHHRAPSGSVTEALEAFRVEEGLEIDGQSAEVDVGRVQGMPDLSAEASSLMDTASLGGDAHTSAIRSVHDKKPASFQSRLKVIGLVVGGLLVLLFVGIQAPKWIDDFREGRADADTPVYVNRAPGILRSGGNPIDALEAAFEAIEYEDSASHRRIAEEALDAVVAEVMGFLAASPFDAANLRRASVLATSASDIFPNDKTVSLFEEVKEDNQIYMMFLKSIDGGSDTATFIMNESGDPQTVAENDVLAGRFLVKEIVRAKSVILEDQMRADRTVVFLVGTGPQ